MVVKVISKFNFRGFMIISRGGFLKTCQKFIGFK